MDVPSQRDKFQILRKNNHQTHVLSNTARLFPKLSFSCGMLRNRLCKTSKKKISLKTM